MSFSAPLMMPSKSLPRRDISITDIPPVPLKLHSSSCAFISTVYGKQHGPAPKFTFLPSPIVPEGLVETFPPDHVYTVGFGASLALFTWQETSPFAKKSTICLAAAPAQLLLASAVWAPIFFGVQCTCFAKRSPSFAAHAAV